MAGAHGIEALSAERWPLGQHLPTLRFTQGRL